MAPLRCSKHGPPTNAMVIFHRSGQSSSRPVFQPADVGFAPKADPRLGEKQIVKTRSASARIFYRACNLVEGFFNKIKQCRQLVKRHDKLAANDLAFVQLASIRLWLRF
jgi:hypothetical protein